jgi:hypothetical protein
MSAVAVVVVSASTLVSNDASYQGIGNPCSAAKQQPLSHATRKTPRPHRRCAYRAPVTASPKAHDAFTRSQTQRTAAWSPD